MRPGSGELLDAIANALDRQVLPALDDKWAASTVRSAVQLLRHLALRVESEPASLAKQAAQLRQALTRVELQLTSPQLVDLRDDVRSALQCPVAAAQDCIALNHEIHDLLAAAERVIAARDRLRSATGSSVIHDELTACLAAQLADEAALIAPFQFTPPI